MPEWIRTQTVLNSVPDFGLEAIMRAVQKTYSEHDLLTDVMDLGCGCYMVIIYKQVEP